MDAASRTGASRSFLACQRAARRDLYCLLNSYTGPHGRRTQPVWRWSEGGSSQDLFSCTDPSLGLDRRRANPCTSLTVDLAGSIWLGGRNGTTHSVLEVVEVDPGGSCSASPLSAGNKFLPAADLTASSDFCVRPSASGRPTLVDMTTSDPVPPVDIALHYVLATTSTGKVIAKQTDPFGTAVPLFQSALLSSCGSSATPPYWIRVSPQSGAAYLSDCNCAVVRQLDVTPSPLALTQTLSPLSTSPAATGVSGSLGTISVSPGIGFNLDECLTSKCILAPNGSDTRNDVGAYITNVEIDPSGQSGLTVFRITGIPDCRHPPHRGTGVCATLANGGIVTIGVQEYLNVAGLLPLEVRALFNDSTQPRLDDLELLIGPQLRARPNPADPATDGTFEAFFGRSEDGSTGVVFRDTFDLKFDIGQLTKSNVSRCGYQSTDPARRNATQWDAITTVSGRTRIDAFATLVSDLYDDLERARVLAACANCDGKASVPLSPTVCSGLAADRANGQDKLNRGELEARTDVILHIFNDQFLPSIPRGGFPQP